MPLTSRFEEPSTGSKHTTKPEPAQRSGLWRISSISSETSVHVRPVASSAATTTSLAHTSSFFTFSPCTLTPPVVPSWPISAARASSSAMRTPAAATAAHEAPTAVASVPAPLGQVLGQGGHSPLCWMSLATRPVQPVWWLAPRPAPLSPWKYS